MCTNPLIGYRKKFSSLTDSSQKYYHDKKIKFKQPPDWWNYEIVKISCGCCMECLLQRSNHWATRIYMESKTHAKNCFITLTYAPEHLPSNGRHMTLRKKHIQDFIKRLRYHAGTEISYFCAGEYGSRTFRPHYHLIVHGWEPEDLKLHSFSKTNNKMFSSKQVEKIWGMGFASIEELNYKTACYTARYCQKKNGIGKIKREYTGEFYPEEKTDERNGQTFIQNRNVLKTSQFDKYGREKEFIVMSKKPAIGLRYWEENKEKIKRNMGIFININGQVILKPIPRYFKKIWEKENQEEYLKAEYKWRTKQAEQNKDKLLKNISLNKKFMDESLLVDNLEKRLNEMNDKNINFKANLLKRSQI